MAEKSKHRQHLILPGDLANCTEFAGVATQSESQRMKGQDRGRGDCKNDGVAALSQSQRMNAESFALIIFALHR